MSKGKSPSLNLEAGKHHRESQRKYTLGAEVPGTITWQGKTSDYAISHNLMYLISVSLGMGYWLVSTQLSLAL